MIDTTFTSYLTLASFWRYNSYHYKPSFHDSMSGRGLHPELLIVFGCCQSPYHAIPRYLFLKRITSNRYNKISLHSFLQHYFIFTSTLNQLSACNQYPVRLSRTLDVQGLSLACAGVEASIHEGGMQFDPYMVSPTLSSKDEYE